MTDPAHTHQVDQALAVINQRLDEFVSEARTAINQHGYETAVAVLNRQLQREAASTDRGPLALSGLAAAAVTRLAQHERGQRE